MTTDARFDWAGVIFGLFVAADGFSAAYWVWPSGAMDTALSQVTIGQLLRVCGSIVLGLVGIVGVVWAIKDANEPFR